MKRRVFYPVLVLALVLAVALPMLLPIDVLASASIDLERGPNPPCYLLNDGLTPQRFWWKITFDTTPAQAVLRVYDPDLVEVYTQAFDLTNMTSPVYNPENTDGEDGMGDPLQSYDWSFDPGIKPGLYEATLEFWSDEVGRESTASQTFWIRQRVRVYKYNDLDGDGSNSPGDLPLEGWEFSVSGPESFSGTTDSTGYAVFPSRNPTAPCHEGSEAYRDILASGAYNVTETLKDGWVNSDPGDGTLQKTFTVPHPTGETIVVEFGNQALAELVIFKYHDENYSGSYDTGEEALEGWEFTITPAPPAVPGNPTPPYTTGADGRITLEVNAGVEYTITEITPLPDGWVNTDPGDGTFQKTATIALGQSMQVNFGNKPMAELVIFKYHDENYSGSYDTGEEALEGWQFTITPAPPAVPGNPTPPYTTGADGRITLEVNAGVEYTITEVTPLPDGWVNTDPGDGTFQKTATIALGQSMQVNFGNKPMAELVIFKYHDENYSGSYDTGEEALEGWQFTVTPAPPAVPGNPTPPYTTGADGRITLEVNAGVEYTITEVTPLPDGWVNTDPGDGTFQKTATIALGQSMQVNFGNKPMAELVIFKYHDENYSGSYDTGEEALEGWEFTITPAPSAVPGNPTPPYTTGADGRITLEVNAGVEYTITEVIPLPTGWVNTDPGDGTFQKTATIGLGQSMQVNFGNVELGKICVEKRDSEGEKLGGWQFSLHSWNITTISWEFISTQTTNLEVDEGWVCWEGLTPGLYEIRETLQDGWAHLDPDDGTLEVTLAAGGEEERTFTNTKPADISLEKNVWDGTNWHDADHPSGPDLPPTMDPVIFRFEIENTGNVTLNVTLTDDDFVDFYTDFERTTAATFPIEMARDEVKTFYGSLAWEKGQHSNTATATGVPDVGDPVSDSDPCHYFGRIPITVGWETHLIDRAAVLAPWIALLATLVAGAGLFAVRRRLRHC